jgi:hypothetical protein
MIPIYNWDNTPTVQPSGPQADHLICVVDGQTPEKESLGAVSHTFSFDLPDGNYTGSVTVVAADDSQVFPPALVTFSVVTPPVMVPVPGNISVTFVPGAPAAARKR